ncbi:MAG: hypothetical protein LUF91_04725 [Oscillospiraceae bacterium]|nr:hypothetical protein [Oscillospiraceae bacterium]
MTAHRLRMVHDPEVTLLFVFLTARVWWGSRRLIEGRSDPMVPGIWTTPFVPRSLQNFATHAILRLDLRKICLSSHPRPLNQHFSKYTIFPGAAQASRGASSPACKKLRRHMALS